MKKIDLNGAWQGTCLTADGRVEFVFDGTVPGCVHTDLMGSRIAKDIYWRDTADSTQWIEDRDWVYEKTFVLAEVPANARLVFEGLDVYADVYVNGTHIAFTDDMFISHTFAVAKQLCVGENRVRVHFHSPVRQVEGLPLRSAAFTAERLYTRRMQCTYGWDWAARLVTCGIWRDAYIDCTEGFGVKNAYIYTESIAGPTAQIVVEAEFENYEAGGVADMEILDPDGNVVYRHRWFRREPMLKEYIDLKNAQLWWPTGFGEQPLYTLRLCGKEFTFGIRTVRILQEPDEPGSEYWEKCLEIKNSASGEAYDKNEEFSGFQLLVNDAPVLCKGANWVPSEPFPSAETDEKITELLELAKESGLNMLRVWGGGIFEKQHFYSECDRLGILVTQDFLMACGHYPEEDPAFIENLRKETEYAAYALRNHPCLMWWSGDNENAVMGDDEAEDYQGRTAIHQGILPVLMQLDPRRRFLLSSPCGGKTYASKTVGTTHNTQYLGCSILPYLYQSDMEDYKEHFAQYLARFIAEEPTLGAVSLSSLKHMMTEEDVFGDLAMWEYHTKSNPALSEPLFETLRQVSQKVLGTFKDGADRFFKMKYLQYEWVRITLENIRRNRGFCNGVVYWMWNDCWPASSGWAFVDYYCKPKASFYSFKRCAAGLLASIHKNNGYEIHLCNDTREEKDVRLVLSYLQNGRVTKLEETTVKAPAAASAMVHTLPLGAVPADAVLLCDALCGETKDRAFYKNGRLPMVPCHVTVKEQTETTVTVTADAYVHAVELEGEFVFEDNYFSLLPGETRTVSFRKIKDAGSSALTVTGYTIEQ